MSLAIVTGANRNPGIGYEIVRGLASRLPTGSKAGFDYCVDNESLETLYWLK